MFLLDIAVRGSIVLAVGLLVCLALRWRAPALRHAVLVATLGAAPLVAPLGLLLPQMDVAVPRFPALTRSVAIPAAPGASPEARASARVGADATAGPARPLANDAPGPSKRPGTGTRSDLSLSIGWATIVPHVPGARHRTSPRQPAGVARAPGARHTAGSADRRCTMVRGARVSGASRRRAARRRAARKPAPRPAGHMGMAHAVSAGASRCPRLATRADAHRPRPRARARAARGLGLADPRHDGSCGVLVESARRDRIPTTVGRERARV